MRNEAAPDKDWLNLKVAPEERSCYLNQLYLNCFIISRKISVSFIIQSVLYYLTPDCNLSLVFQYAGYSRCMNGSDLARGRDILR